MAQIPVAMLEIDEGEPGFLRAYRRQDKGVDQLFDFGVGEAGIGGAQADFGIQERMVVENPRNRAPSA
jgi:hypothetical protein